MISLREEREFDKWLKSTHYTPNIPTRKAMLKGWHAGFRHARSPDGLFGALYDQAHVVSQGKISVHDLQRHLEVGYTLAFSLVEQMGLAGVISQPADNGSRKVLLKHDSEVAEVNQVDKRAHRE